MQNKNKYCDMCYEFMEANYFIEKAEEECYDVEELLKCYVEDQVKNISVINQYSCNDGLGNECQRILKAKFCPICGKKLLESK